MGFYREFPAWQLRQEQVVSPKQTALGIFRRCQSDSAPGQIIARSFGTEISKKHILKWIQRIQTQSFQNINK